MLVFLAIGALFGLSSILMLVVNQEKLMFKPKTGFTEQLDIWNTQHHALQLDSGERAHFFKKKDDRGVLIYNYGNASNADHSLERLRWFSEHLNLSIFVADYPGYGQNPGEPGEASIRTLMKRWWQVFEKEHGYSAEHRYVWGHSLGGAVASLSAGEMGCAGLILESTFNNMLDMAGSKYPFLPMSWICRHPFRSDLALASADFPIVMFHSKDDSVVPIELGRRLRDSLSAEVTWMEFNEGGHHHLTEPHGKDMLAKLRTLFPDVVKTEI